MYEKFLLKRVRVTRAKLSKSSSVLAEEAVRTSLWM